MKNSRLGKLLQTRFPWIALVAIASGCSMIPGAQKSEEAQLADYSRHLYAIGGEPFGSLTRSSGEILFKRLSTLFPNNPSGILYPEHFLPASADGLNRAIAQAERPTSSLAQIAMRAKTLALCSGDLAKLDTGAIFSETGVYLRGESAPAKTETRLALAAARNTWLYPYSADSAEVKELEGLYLSIKNSSNDAEARRAVCVAVTSAPQFSIGNPKKGDAVRRVYLEVGRQIPKLQDIADFEAGRVTLGSLVGKMQTDSTQKPGYLSSVQSWHREWLGLRPFLEGDDNYEPRRYNGAASGAHSFVAGADIGNAMTVGGKKLAVISNDGGYQVQNCQPGTEAQANVQAFDPRTTMILWEFRNPVANRWEIFGAFVHPDRLGEYQNLIRGYAGNEAEAIPSQCTSMDQADPEHAVAGSSDYLLCKGRIAGIGGGFMTTGLEEVSGDNLMGSLTVPGAISFISSRLREQTVLGSFFPSDRFVKKDMRVRRFSPSGEQNGVSAVKLWYTGESVYMCNAFERYLATCNYRPPAYTQGPSGWAWISDYGWSATNSWAKFGTYIRVDSFANPRILNQMRCGNPNGNELSSLSSIPSEGNAYPLGYDASREGYLNGNPPPESALNPVATNVNNRGAGELEIQAIRRLRSSITNEPYNLVNHIIENNLPYSDLVTAKYTIGTAELELYYRDLALHLPTYVSGSGPVSGNPDLRVIRIDSFPNVSSNFVSPPNANTRDRPVSLRPRPAAGILTMPAFLTPVGARMRTIASRYFTRLLCGEANLFQPNKSQATLHEKYMSDSANQTANASVKAHLDHKQVCYGCHVNLDPLAQALGPNFLRNVQENENAAILGEMTFTQITNQSNGMIGAIWGSEIGKGALLGQEISGVEGVGQAIGRSDLFAQCIVRRTFENVVGRPIASTDETEFNRWVSDFKKNGMNYNRLIRTIVDSPIYSGGN